MVSKKMQIRWGGFGQPADYKLRACRPQSAGKPLEVAGTENYEVILKYKTI